MGQGAVDQILGVKLIDYEERLTMLLISPEEESRCRLATRLLLARATVQAGNSRCFKWWSYCPLYRHMDFSRPSELGDICAHDRKHVQGLADSETSRFLRECAAGREGGRAKHESVQGHL